MMFKHIRATRLYVIVILLTLLLSLFPHVSYAATSSKINMRDPRYLTMPKSLPQSLVYDHAIHIDYPIQDGVKGIYVPTSLLESKVTTDTLLAMMDQTALNSVVIDIKNEQGLISFSVPSSLSTSFPTVDQPISSISSIMEQLEEHHVYPIARIVAFKDNQTSYQFPNRSFTTSSNTVWRDGQNNAYLNPYVKENWTYIAQLALFAVELGFKDIQLDAVHFPEGFASYSNELTYQLGDYQSLQDTPQARIQAITDFVRFMKDILKSYGVRLSINIPFGVESSLIRPDQTIGQDTAQLAAIVDTFSAMIYPSLWYPVYFDLNYPDLYPYETIFSYAQQEKKAFRQLLMPPTSRPWIQDFTSQTLPSGTYQSYGIEEINKQIQALKDAGITEYLLWNETGRYTSGVLY